MMQRSLIMTDRRTRASTEIGVHTTAGWHQPSGLGYQPAEDAPSGASAAITRIRRQCRNNEPELFVEQLGEIPGFARHRARGKRAQADGKRGSTHKLTQVRKQNQPCIRSDVHGITLPFSNAQQITMYSTPSVCLAQNRGEQLADECSLCSTASTINQPATMRSGGWRSLTRIGMCRRNFCASSGLITTGPHNSRAQW